MEGGNQVLPEALRCHTLFRSVTPAVRGSTTSRCRQIKRRRSTTPTQRSFKLTCHRLAPPGAIRSDECQHAKTRGCTDEPSAASATAAHEPRGNAEGGPNRCTSGSGSGYKVPQQIPPVPIVLAPLPAVGTFDRAICMGSNSQSIGLVAHPPLGANMLQDTLSSLMGQMQMGLQSEVQLGIQSHISVLHEQMTCEIRAQAEISRQRQSIVWRPKRCCARRSRAGRWTR